MRRLGDGDTATGLQPTRDRLVSALLAGRVGTWHWDRRRNRVEWDKAMYALFGLGTDDAFEGTFDSWMEHVHPGDRDHVLACIERAITDGDTYGVEHRVVLPDGSIRWLEGRGDVVRDEDDVVTGMVGIGYDVTERVEAEQTMGRLYAAEQLLRQRLALLADASAILARSLNTDRMLRELAALLVGRLGDWCLVHLREHGGIRCIATAHEHSTAQDAPLPVEPQLPPECGPGSVVRTGEPILLEQVDTETLRSICQSDEEVEQMLSLGLSSAMIAPLRARGRTIGALTVLSTNLDRQYGHDDLSLAVDLGTRAGIAVDNARLFAEQRRVATILQDSLLPPVLPDVPRVAIAASYEPATDGFDVGGDFYDIFENPDRRTWTVLIGDVRGKGPDAAALSGLCRQTVRAAALRDANPVHILAVLNEALVKHQPVEHFCTAICAQIEPTDEGLVATVAGGGHPPAMVLRTGGMIQPVPASPTLIGMFADARTEAAPIRLEPGESLFLYTDGVLDARRGDELFGQERLRRTLAEAAGFCAEDLVQHVRTAVREFRGPDHRDDIAMLALTRTQHPAGHGH